MNWNKKSTGKTVAEVIKEQTGLTLSDFKKDWFTPIVNLDKVVQRLKEIACENKTVTVFADYDCDGITSALIMHKILSNLYIQHNILFPHRNTGYGMHDEDIDKINSDILITVDNGIAAISTIKKAKEKGIEVIIIDHHLAVESGELPPADIIVNPHIYANDGDFINWCAAGLVYRLACEILSDKNDLSEVLQYAAIGTVADVVEVVKDNHTIIKKGLEEINSNPTVNLNLLLLKMNNDKPMYIDEETIGYKIAPVINAISRVEDNAEYAYNYFLNGNIEMADHLIENNIKRQTLVSGAVKQAQDYILDNCLFGDFPLIIQVNALDGIVGIVAGKIAEQMQVPVICVTETEEGILKGSARSASINIKEALDKVKDLLISYGGHSGAAGLKFRKENLEKIRIKFSAIYGTVDIGKSDINYDLEIEAKDVPQICDELLQYAPYGQGHRKIQFKINNFRLLPKNGQWFNVYSGNTIKILGEYSTAIGFGDVYNIYEKENFPKKVNMIGTIGENYFMGNRSVEITITTLQKAKDEKKKSSLALLLEEELKKKL